jgi:hypothetical protein
VFVAFRPCVSFPFSGSPSVVLEDATDWDSGQFSVVAFGILDGLELECLPTSSMFLYAIARAVSPLASQMVMRRLSDAMKEGLVLPNSRRRARIASSQDSSSSLNSFSSRYARAINFAYSGTGLRDIRRAPRGRVSVSTHGSSWASREGNQSMLS